MTGRLNVTLECGFSGDPQPGVLTHLAGNIYASTPGGESRRRIALPLGWNAPPVGFDLPAGRYVVEASLPSGLILTEDVEVVDGETSTVTLDVTDSPHESHTLQYVVGNIEPSAVYHGLGSYPVPNSRPSQSYVPATQDDTRTGTGGAVAVDGGGGNGMDGVLPPTSVDGGGGVGTPPDPAEIVLLLRAQEQAPGIAPLADLREADPGTIPARVSELLGAEPTVAQFPAFSDPLAPLYRFAEPPGQPTVIPLRQHQYLLVSGAGRHHLVTLPWPWIGPGGEASAVEVLVNLRQSPTGSAVSVTVRDPVVGGGLGYLAAGALDRAAVLFADVEGMLYGKVSNRLAAAAGGYVLVGTESTGQRQRWDAWLVNLRDWFPGMSDGAVLLATRMLRTATGDEDAAAAKQVLLDGYARGLPVYTLGLTWLLDGLSAFPDDPVCADAMQKVRRLSWQVDMREPFTVVRLGREP